MASLREQLAAAQHEVRRCRDDMELVETVIRQKRVEASGGSKNMGSNQQEREQVLKHALLTDTRYQAALSRLREAEKEADHLEAGVQDTREYEARETRRVYARVADVLEQLPKSTNLRATADHLVALGVEAGVQGGLVHVNGDEQC